MTTIRREIGKRKVMEARKGVLGSNGCRNGFGGIEEEKWQNTTLYKRYIKRIENKITKSGKYG